MRSAVLPGCNNLQACIYTKERYLAMTLGLQQQLCTGATRQPAGPWRHGDVTGPQVRIKLALCVFVIMSYCWLVSPPPHDLYCYRGETAA